MARPARVLMRWRKPWFLARRRLFGWNVRLLTVLTFVRSSQARSVLSGLEVAWSRAADRPSSSGDTTGRAAPRIPLVVVDGGMWGAPRPARCQQAKTAGTTNRLARLHNGTRGRAGGSNERGSTREGAPPDSYIPSWRHSGAGHTETRRRFGRLSHTRANFRLSCPIWTGTVSRVVDNPRFRTGLTLMPICGQRCGKVLHRHSRES